MLFSELASYFDRIENISSRLEMSQILAEMLSKAAEKEIASVIYLSQGVLGPRHTALEAGIGEGLLEQGIAKATGYPKDEVAKLYKQMGDLGLVAEKLVEGRKQGSLFSEKLTVEKVFNNFARIAQTEGRGSQDLKLGLFAELLNSASKVEARYIARFPLGNLRLGVGDPTLIDSLALNYLDEFTQNSKIRREIERGLREKKEDKRAEEFALRARQRLRAVIEAKYNIFSDLGEIAKKLKAGGLRGLDEIEIVPGAPIRPTLAERLPSAWEVVKKLGRCAVEAKYDGFRCITGLTTIYVNDKGLVPVKDVKVGDMVLTHRGKFRKVIAKNVRKIEKREMLFRLQTYLGNEFKITEKHRILVKAKGLRWVPIEKVSKSDWVAFPKPAFTKKSILRTKLELRTQAGYEKTIKVNNDFFRFLGYWIGDGFTNEFHNTERIGLIFNQKTEKELCDEYEKIIKKLFRIEKISRNIHNGAIYLYWRDETFKKWLTKHFRREWKGKMLPQWFYGVSKGQFESFLKGWLESDGYSDDQNRQTITTKEKDLAMFAQLLALKFGKIIGVKKIRVKVGKFTGTYYKLVLPKSERHAVVSGNHVLVKILRLEKIKRPDPRTTLYNLQVEGDESYCSTMISLHNCQIHKHGDNVIIFSRQSENITEMFPDIVQAVRSQIRAGRVIFEGEALAYSEGTGQYFPFQVTIQRKRKYDVAEKAEEFPLRLFAFDIMYLDGKNMMGKPFSERRAILKKIIGRGDAIVPTKSIETDDPKKIEEFFLANIESGLEGIIAKDLGAPYIAGARKFAWIKLKRSYKGELSDSVDVTIIGYFKGRGKRTQFGLGGLLSAVYDEDSDSFKSIAKIGTGMSEEMLSELESKLSKIAQKQKPARVECEIEPHVWVKPFYVIEVRADEITRSPMHTAGKDSEGTGYALRFPRMIKFREKKPEESTTVKEIITMFKRQGSVQVGGAGL